VGDGRRAQF
jgi:hypothetical protein